MTIELIAEALFNAYAEKYNVTAVWGERVVRAWHALEDRERDAWRAVAEKGLDLYVRYGVDR